MEIFLDYLTHIIIPFLLLVFITLILVLIINRIIFEVFKFRLRLVKAKIDIFLTSLVFSPLDQDGFALQIGLFKKRIPFKKQWCKEIILNEIVNLKQNLKGEVVKSIHFIFEEFNLLNYCLRFLKNKKWYVKSAGIYYLQALEYNKAVNYVLPYMNHKNKILSSNAYIALISLTPDKLDFLSEYENPISLTSQIKVMDVLHTKKPSMPTNLKLWINAKNPCIVKLGIKFMVYFNYVDDSQDVMNHIYANDHSIRYEVIIAARDLFIPNAEQVLIKQFFEQTKNNQIETLKTLAIIGTHDSEQFIKKNILEKEIDNDIKLESVYCVCKINPNYFDFYFTEDPNILKMLKHVKDPFI